MFKKLKGIFEQVKAKATKFAAKVKESVAESSVQIKASFARSAAVGLSACAALVATVLPTSAATEPVEIAITQEQVEVILDYIVQNIAVVMPVGIAVMGIMLGIGIIPRLIKKFMST